jgi:hypothetical protein
MFSETHAAQRDMLIRDIIAKMRHDGCGGRAGQVELLTGIEGASSRPVRKVTLIQRSRDPGLIHDVMALTMATSKKAPAQGRG